MTLSPRRFAGVAAVAAATLVVATVAATAPARAAGETVTVQTTVNSVVDGVAYTGGATTVALTLTNGSTTGAQLGAFYVVLPPGITDLATGPVDGPGTWNESVVPCGAVPACSSILLVSAGLPLTDTLVNPGGTVTATVSFTAPEAAGSYPLTLTGIGGGIFSVSGPTPTLRVRDITPTSLSVAVATPVVAGTAADVTVGALNAADEPVPFTGTSMTLSLGTPDAGATVGGDPAVAGSWTVPVAAGGLSYTFPAVFTKAGTQRVLASGGAIAGDSDEFDVAGAAPHRLTITSVQDTSKNPPLPTPAAGQAFAVRFSVLDRFGNLASAPVTASLAAVNAASGTLTAAPVTTSGGTGIFDATFSKPQLGLVLRVSSGSLISDTATIDLVIAGDSAAGGPDVPEELGAGGATGSLPNGSYGPVYLTTSPCGDPSCTQATEISFDGVFSDPEPAAGTEPRHLYSFADPAKVTWTCAASQCVHGPLAPPYALKSICRFSSSVAQLSIVNKSAAAASYSVRKSGSSAAPLTGTAVIGTTIVKVPWVNGTDTWILSIGGQTLSVRVGNNAVCQPPLPVTTADPSFRLQRLPEKEEGGSYLYNRGSISDLNEQEQVEDFRWFPIQVSLKINGEYQPFAQAPACSAFVSNPALIKTGVIDSAAAKTAGFCVDVYAISRAGNSFTGALTLPVLFVEDPKLRP